MRQQDKVQQLRATQRIQVRELLQLNYDYADIAQKMNWKLTWTQNFCKRLAAVDRSIKLPTDTRHYWKEHQLSSNARMCEIDAEILQARREHLITPVKLVIQTWQRDGSNNDW